MVDTDFTFQYMLHSLFMCLDTSLFLMCVLSFCSYYKYIKGYVLEHEDSYINILAVCGHLA